MNDLPSDPKKLRARLRRYERKLRAEKAETGYFSDGSGLRYLVGPLYLLLGDLPGAAKSYTWFAREFPDDAGEPGNDLCWALLLYRLGDQEAAARKLRQGMLRNLYLLPRLLESPRKPLPVWDGLEWSEANYVAWIPDAFWTLWDTAALDWAKNLYASEDFQTVERRYTAIEEELSDLPPGPRRSALVKEASALRRE